MKFWDVRRITGTHARVSLQLFAYRFCFNGFLILSVLTGFTGCWKSPEQVRAEIEKNETALREAARRGDTAVVKQLLDKGVVVNCSDARGANPLMESAASGSAETVRILLSAGATVNAVDKAGRTALFIAVNVPSKDVAMDQRIALIRELLNAGATIEARDIHHRTPVIEAATWGSPEIIRQLKDAGADLESADFAGMTPLMWAANQMITVKDTTSNVRFLVDEGANVKAKSRDGLTALDYAEKHGSNQKIIEILREAGGVSLAKNESKVPEKDSKEKPEDEMTEAVEDLLSFGMKALNDLNKQSAGKPDEKQKENKPEKGIPSSGRLPDHDLSKIQVTCSRNVNALVCLVNNNSRFIVSEVIVRYRGTSGEKPVSDLLILRPEHAIPTRNSAIVTLPQMIPPTITVYSYAVEQAFGNEDRNYRGAE